MSSTQLRTKTRNSILRHLLKRKLFPSDHREHAADCICPLLTITHMHVISGRRTGTLVVDDALEAPDDGVPPRPLVRGGHLVAQDALEQRGDGGAVGARRPRQAAQVRHVRLRLKQHRRRFKQMLFFNRHTYGNSFF